MRPALLTVTAYFCSVAAAVVWVVWQAVRAEQGSQQDFGQ